MIRVKPLFRYAGNKAKLLTTYAPFFDGLHPQHCVDYCSGSGTMSLWFHQLYPDAKLYLNEKDPDIYGLFKCIQENYDRLHDQIYDLQRTKAIWKGFDAQKRLYYSIRDYYNLQFVSICADDGHALDFENEEDREELDAMGYINFGPLGYDVFQHAWYFFLRKLSFSGVN